MTCDIAGMAKERKPLDIKIGAAIKEARKARGLTGREVAEKLSTSTGAVGNWERGANRPDAENLFAVAELLKADSKALARGEFVSLSKNGASTFDPDEAEYEFDPDLEVPVVGYVGAGAGAHYYQVDNPSELERVQAPKESTKKTVAVEVKGDSLGPLFNRWLVYYDDVHSPVTPDLIGRLCVVGLPDDRILVKQIRQSRKFRGMFDLISNRPDEPVIEGVEIAWAAKVTDMKLRS